MDTVTLLQTAVQYGASDIFMVAGKPVTIKIAGVFSSESDEVLLPAAIEKHIREIYALARRNMEETLADGDDDFSFSIPRLSRFRISVYRQRGTLAAVVRVVAFELPDPAALSIPDRVLNLADHTKGLIIITGPAGSGKSTTLACIVDRINSTRCGHIITLEDPIEFLHPHKKSIVSQREVSIDTKSYVSALRAALRQAPDVVLLGEMRDSETIATALTAAETGHLVLSSLHTLGAANTIDRIIDAFPSNQQNQVRVQLAMVLRAVVSQQLLPTIDGGMVPAFEIMLVNNAISNLIRESKVHQIDSVIFSAGNEMLAMDSSILELYTIGRIDRKTALLYASNPDFLERRLSSAK